MENGKYAQIFELKKNICIKSDSVSLNKNINICIIGAVSDLSKIC